MPRRTTPPLTNLERCQRYRMKHPEKTEEYRLHKRKIRAEARQKELAERLALATAANAEDAEIDAKIAAIAKHGKINTGLTKEENPDMFPTIQGSKV